MRPISFNNANEHLQDPNAPSTATRQHLVAPTLYSLLCDIVTAPALHKTAEGFAGCPGCLVVVLEHSLTWKRFLVYYLLGTFSLTNVQPPAAVLIFLKDYV
jgi:hypothetical protein